MTENMIDIMIFFLQNRKMNRRQFLKKSLEGIIVGSIPLIYSCSENPIKSEIDELDIIDFTIVKNITYLLTGENDVYEMSSSDKATLIKKNDKKTYYTFKLKELLTNNIDLNRYEKICRDDNFLYGIILAGYSSRFVKIVPSTGDEEFLNYIKGEPGGIFISDSKIWYIFNGKNVSSILESYDKYNGNRIDKMINTTLNDVIGLSIDKEGNFITYEKISNSFVKFKIENNEFKLLDN